MADAFGVLPTGVNIKQLSDILQEIEAENAQAAVFGPSIIQTAQSPLGQTNALFGDYSADLWQFGAGVYQSMDIDQAEGSRIDTLAKLQGLTRATDETDIEFQARTTNFEKTDISLTVPTNAVLAVDGVEWVYVRENNTDTTDTLGIPPNSLAFAVVGGTDEAVAQAIHDNTVPGIGLIGNTHVQITSGYYCKSIGFIRPVDIPISLVITVRQTDDLCQCSPSDTSAIGEAVVAALMGTCGLRNADGVTVSKVRAPVEALGGLEVVSVEMAFEGDAFTTGPLAIGLYERALITTANISASFV